MRIFMCASILFGLLIGGIVVYECALVYTGHAIEQDTQSLLDGILQKDTQKVEENVQMIDEKWKGARKLLMAFSEHTALDRIEEKLEYLKSAVVYTSWQDMYKEAKSFQMLLKNEFKSSVPTLTNIL